MVSGLIFCTTLISCRSGHTPFAQTGVETSDTGAEVIGPNSSCSGSIGVASRA